MPKVKKKTDRVTPYSSENRKFTQFFSSDRSGRRNAVANILDEPQVAANLAGLILPANMEELKLSEEIRNVVGSEELSSTDFCPTEEKGRLSNDLKKSPKKETSLNVGVNPD